MRKIYSTPGVYIQEHTFRPPTIEPASTAIAAIIDSFPEGVILLTGTGVVPGDDFTLSAGDVVRITISGIGTLENPVVQDPAS